MLCAVQQSISSLLPTSAMAMLTRTDGRTDGRIDPAALRQCQWMFTLCRKSTALDQTSPLPRPMPDDLMSLGGRSSLTSSTDLPLDFEASRQEFGDMQESLTKTLTKAVPRVLPPYNPVDHGLRTYLRQTADVRNGISVCKFKLNGTEMVYTSLLRIPASSP